MIKLVTTAVANMDGIPVPIVQLGPWALFLLLVFLVVRAVVKGDLVPRKTHEDTLNERDMWKAAYMLDEQALQEERDQKRELMAAARLGAQVMGSLPLAPGQEPTPSKHQEHGE